MCIVWIESTTTTAGRSVLDLLEDGLDVRLRQDQHVDVAQSEALGAQPHLLRRLLAGDVEDREPLRAPARRTPGA